MKNLLVGICCIVILSSCSDQKSQFDDAVLSQMENDQDVKDYNIDPEIMKRCVVDLTSKKMPGIIYFDPRRGPLYEGYAKIISLRESSDPKKSLFEIQELFGSPEALRKALINYSSSVMECTTSLVARSERAINLN